MAEKKGLRDKVDAVVVPNPTDLRAVIGKVEQDASHVPETAQIDRNERANLVALLKIVDLVTPETRVADPVEGDAERTKSVRLFTPDHLDEAVAEAITLVRANEGERRILEPVSNSIFGNMKANLSPEKDRDIFERIHKSIRESGVESLQAEWLKIFAPADEQSAKE